MSRMNFQILQEITFLLRDEKKNLQAFERLLVRFDLYNAKVRFASSYTGIIQINKNSKMYWEEAFHPIFF